MASLRGGLQLPILVVIAVLGCGKEYLFKVLMWARRRGHIFFFRSTYSTQSGEGSHRYIYGVVNMRIKICSHCSRCELASLDLQCAEYSSSILLYQMRHCKL